jgi:hypothetical protein
METKAEYVTEAEGARPTTLGECAQALRDNLCEECGVQVGWVPDAIEEAAKAEVEVMERWVDSIGEAHGSIESGEYEKACRHLDKLGEGFRDEAERLSGEA